MLCTCIPIITQPVYTTLAKSQPQCSWPAPGTAPCARRGDWYQSQYQPAAYPIVLQRNLQTQLISHDKGGVVPPLTSSWNQYCKYKESSGESARLLFAKTQAYKLVGDRIQSAGTNDFRCLSAIDAFTDTTAVSKYLAENQFVPGSSLLPTPQHQVGQVGWAYTAG